MKKIKFRGWDTKEKFMFSVDEVHFPQGGVHVYGPGIAEGWSEIYVKFRDKLEEMIILMQYTGLKDKNGTEIYEGDIIQVEPFHIYSVTVQDFHGYRFMLGKDQLTKSDGIYGVIIGNIYEHPELLDTRKLE